MFQEVNVREWKKGVGKWSMDESQGQKAEKKG